MDWVDDSRVGRDGDGNRGCLGWGNPGVCHRFAMRGLHTQWIESRYLLLNASDGVLFIGHDEVVVFIKHFHILEIQLAHLGDVLGLGGLMGGEFLGLLAIGLRLGSAGRLPFMFGLLDLEGAFAVVLADQVLFVAGDGAEHGGDLADAILGGPVIAHELEDEDLVEVHEGGEVGGVVGFEPFCRKLVRDGILSACCSRCGIKTWQGQPITIQIDHINGLRDDWRIENLRMLCPNCHSQTPTFAGRNLKHRDRPGCKDAVPSCSITVAAIPGSSNGRTQASEVCYRGSSP